MYLLLFTAQLCDREYTKAVALMRISSQNKNYQDFSDTTFYFSHEIEHHKLLDHNRTYHALTMENVMNSNNSNEIIIVESDEVVVVSARKSKMMMMIFSHESLDYEEFRMKIVESDIVLGTLY